MPNFTISRNLESGLLLRQSGLYVRALANEPLSSVGDGMRFPHLVENLYRNSETATSTGTVSNVTFGANTFNLNLDGSVFFGDNSLNRSWSDTGSLSASTLYSFAFIIKPDNGIAPTFGTGGTNIARWRFSNIAASGAYTITDIGGGRFFVQGSGSTTSAALSTNGLIKSSINNAIGFEASAFMVVEGSVNWNSIEDYLADYLRTTGSAVTGVFPDVSQNIGAWGDITFLVDVTLPSAPSVVNRIFSWGLDNNNRIMCEYIVSGRIRFQNNVASVVNFQIESDVVGSGNYRIAIKVSNGNNRMYINGNLVNSNTLNIDKSLYDVLRLGANIVGTGTALQGAWLREFNVVPFMSDADALAWTQS
jgi:hypothetical protein